MWQIIIAVANIVTHRVSLGGQYRLKGGHLYTKHIKKGPVYFQKKYEKVYLCFK